jgi:hypothetical protein
MRYLFAQVSGDEDLLVAKLDAKYLALDQMICERPVANAVHHGRVWETVQKLLVSLRPSFGSMAVRTLG